MNSANALICWKDKILLFHRDNIPTISNPDCWSLPGGGIEKGETPLQGLQRELNEEVSYIPKNIQFLLKIPRKDGTTFGYICFVDDSEARLFNHGPGEGQGIKFFTINKALKLKLTPELKNYLIKFQDELGKVMATKSVREIKVKRIFEKN